MEKTSYKPVDLARVKGFNPKLFRGKHSLVIPSQGSDFSNLLNHEGEMAYEQRQLSLAMGKYPGIFVTRKPFPSAEKNYWQQLFSGSNGGMPIELVTPFSLKDLNLPLDRIILNHPANLKYLKEIVSAHQDKYKIPLTVQSFHQTHYLQKIADELELQYYGNADFAEWAGSKTGLIEFAEECDVAAPLTYKITDFTDLYGQIDSIAEAGYEEIVIKVNFSTGGMGHRRLSIGEALKACEQGYYEQILPPEYDISEGAIVQGWIPNALSLSVATFVDFDGSYEFTGAQIHELKMGNAFSAIGAMPMDASLVDRLLVEGHKIAKCYVAHKAYGPHTMGFIAPDDEWCQRLGIEKGTLFANDENSRPGASTISLNWILAIRDGRYGAGWRVTKIPVNKGSKIGGVINKLKKNGLLIQEPSQDATGVFVYGGLILDSGYEDQFYAISVSGSDSFDEANEIMERTQRLFKES